MYSVINFLITQKGKVVKNLFSRKYLIFVFFILYIFY